jgi:hypothetical protein
MQESASGRPTGDLAADPNHHFADVTEQLYGVPDPAPGQLPDMSGMCATAKPNPAAQPLAPTS